jgi:hypothetical protein
MGRQVEAGAGEGGDRLVPEAALAKRRRQRLALRGASSWNLRWPPSLSPSRNSTSRNCADWKPLEVPSTPRNLK